MKKEFPFQSRRDHILQPCVALIDQHYLSWLLGSTPESGPINRFALAPVLSALLEQVAVQAMVQRVYWYASERADPLPQGLVQREVAPHETDKGASVQAALAADLKALGEHRAYRHLILVSDDQRLVPLIDAAQLRGVAVHILADQASRNLEQLRSEDPEWASLLGQADSRLLLSDLAVRDLLQQRTTRGAPRAAAAPEDLESIRRILTEAVQNWWDEEPEDLREELREELEQSRGIPQEVDRHLLLRVRKTIDRTLVFEEKKLLREMVRSTVLGEQPLAQEQPVT